MTAHVHLTQCALTNSQPPTAIVSEEKSIDFGTESHQLIRTTHPPSQSHCHITNTAHQPTIPQAYLILPNLSKNLKNNRTNPSNSLSTRQQLRTPPTHVPSSKETPFPESPPRILPVHSRRPCTIIQNLGPLFNNQPARQYIAKSSHRPAYPTKPLLHNPHIQCQKEIVLQEPDKFPGTRPSLISPLHPTAQPCLNPNTQHQIPNPTSSP